MTQALPGPLMNAIGWALLHLVWQGALVAAVLAVVLACLPGRSQVRYVLSCLALTLIVLLGVATGIRSYRAGADRGDVVGEPAGRTMFVTPPLAGPVAATPDVPPRGDRLDALLVAVNEALPRIVTVWLAGVLLISCRLALEWLRVRRLLSPGAPSAPEPWPSIARRLGAALGVRHVVRVLETAAVEVPSVIGLARPAILIPASALAGLTPAQLEMILVHELAHVRRHDFLVNLLQTVVETLLFYHPAVWWISRQIRAERENCCDDLAVLACGDRLQYARALLRLDEVRAQRLALAMSADGASLIERIRRIALGSRTTSGSAVRAVGALAVPLFMVIAIALPSISSIARTRDAQSGASAAAAERTERATHDSPPSSATARPAAGTDATPAEIAEQPADGAPRMDAEAEVDLADQERPTLEELIALRTQGVTPDEVREIRSLLGNVSLQDIATMKAVGASPAFIREMRRAGLAVKTPQEAQGLAALGVTRAFVKEMRSVGFPVASAEEAQGLKAVGVSAAFVRDLRSRGLAVDAEKAQSFAAVGVTPEYIDELQDAGVDVSDLDQVQSLRALGITPQFIRRLADAGYRNLSVEQLTRLGAAGVNGDFVREMSRYRSR